MSWKRNIQARDLDVSDRILATCKSCGHIHYVTRASICVSPEREFLYLDEVEAETTCRARGCRGSVRFEMTATEETSGFVGGLA